MRVSEVLDRVDRLRPNAVDKDDKILHLWHLEAQIAEMQETDAPDWDESDVEDYVMLLPDPWSEWYIFALCTYVDYVQEETELYQIDSIMANEHLSKVQSWWRKNNKESDTTQFRGIFL